MHSWVFRLKKGKAIFVNKHPVMTSSESLVCIISERKPHLYCLPRVLLVFAPGLDSAGAVCMAGRNVWTLGGGPSEFGNS